MKGRLEEGKSIYLQISESVEDSILSGLIGEEEPVPSSNQFAKLYSINPATAAKGVALLAEEGILYKKRGLGMYVAKGAREQILQKRRREFYDKYVRTLLAEAEKIGLDKNELIRLIEADGAPQSE